MRRAARRAARAAPAVLGLPWPRRAGAAAAARRAERALPRCRPGARRRPASTRLVADGATTGPRARSSHALKFRGAPRLARVHGRPDRAPACRRTLARRRRSCRCPANPAAGAVRGYDHAALLARALGELSGRPVLRRAARAAARRWPASAAAGRARRLAAARRRGARRRARSARLRARRRRPHDRRDARRLRRRTALGAARSRASARSPTHASSDGTWEPWLKQPRRALASASHGTGREESNAIEVKGLNVEVTDELREHVEKRFEKVDRRSPSSPRAT